MNIRKGVIVVMATSLLLLVGVEAALAQAQAQADISAFVSLPDFDAIRISPKGKYLAFTHKAGDEEHLIVVHADDLSAVSQTTFGSATDIKSFYWVNEERILMAPGRSFQGALDFKQSTGEIFGIDADGKRFEILFGYRIGSGTAPTGTRVRTRKGIYASGRIVDLLPEDPDHVIVQSMGYGVEGEINQAWTMDVDTGRLRELTTSPIRNGVFITDSQHEIRFVRGYNTQDVGELYGLNEDDEWELLVTEDDEARWVEPIGPYGRDGTMLVGDQSDTGTWGLSLWNPATMRREPLFHHADVDVSELFFDNQSRYWAVQYIDHFPEYFYPDDSHPFVALHTRLRAMFGEDVHVEILDETDELDKAVVFVSGPGNPGDFYLVDTRTGEFLLRMPRYSNPPAELLSRMDPIELVVRDGETIRGYLTVPTNVEERMLPMVVMPHGGPHGVYDTWDYHFESQLLASRGYVVLQVNFRGSGGRSASFMEAGYGEWGGRMQDDLTDATHWAISEGIADPDRICIYGESYGGYASLMGAVKEPDLYQCAIGMSGVYDLNLMFQSGDVADAERGLSYMREVLGEDRTLLETRSPVANADKIEANVMLIHGLQDERAPIEHAERMREALMNEGKEVVWITENREAHGILSDDNRVRVYQGILDFLELNIGL